jgi:hypothetical protein
MHGGLRGGRALHLANLPNEVLLLIFHVLDDVGQVAAQICLAATSKEFATVAATLPMRQHGAPFPFTTSKDQFLDLPPVQKSTCQASKKRYAIGSQWDTCSVTRAHNGNAVIALYVRPHRYLGEPLMLHHLEAALLTAVHLQKVHAIPS